MKIHFLSLVSITMVSCVFSELSAAASNSSDICPSQQAGKSNGIVGKCCALSSGAARSAWSRGAQIWRDLAAWSNNIGRKINANIKEQKIKQINKIMQLSMEGNWEALMEYDDPLALLEYGDAIRNGRVPGISGSLREELWQAYLVRAANGAYSFSAQYLLSMNGRHQQLPEWMRFVGKQDLAVYEDALSILAEHGAINALRQCSGEFAILLCAKVLLREGVGQNIPDAMQYLRLVVKGKGPLANRAKKLLKSLEQKLALLGAAGDSTLESGATGDSTLKSNLDPQPDGTTDSGSSDVPSCVVSALQRHNFESKHDYSTTPSSSSVSLVGAEAPHDAPTT
jgi:hypothetical protein